MDGTSADARKMEGRSENNAENKNQGLSSFHRSLFASMGGLSIDTSARLSAPSFGHDRKLTDRNQLESV